MKLVVMQNVSLTKHLALSTYLQGVLESFGKREDVSTIALISEGYTDGRATRFTVRASHTDLYTVLGNLKYFVWALWSLIREGQRTNIDVIHTLYPSSSTLAALLFRTLFSRQTVVIYDIRSPWIMMAGNRGRIPKRFKSLILTVALLVERVLIKWVDGVIFITEGLRETYARLGLTTKKPIHISPSGVDTVTFTPHPRGAIRDQLQLTADSKIIGYVGGIAKTRDLQFLLDVASQCREKTGPKWHIVFVGDGDYKRELMRQVERLQLTNVHFIGPFPHDDIPRIISDIDVGVCHLPRSPLFNTSFPMKILEYLACGVPVLASRIPTHEEIARKIEGVVIYDFTPESFVSAVNIAMRQQIDTRGLAMFSWSAITDALVKLFRQLLRN